MEKIRCSILMGGGKTLLLGFALLVIALAVTSCEQPDKGPVAVDSITINKLETTDIVFEGGTVKKIQLMVDIQPDNATDTTVVWSSFSDENAATVSDDGTVAINCSGKATITAEAGGKSASASFEFGEGYFFYETENTYYIWTEDGLLAWNAYVTTNGDYSNPGRLKTNAVLLDSIELTVLEEGRSTWTPVRGYYDYVEYVEYYYAGTFDGKGHTISNLKIESPDSYYSGLFGYIATDGVVKDLTLSNVAISGASYIGGIAGMNYGTIENCSVSGSVSGSFAIGGIVGYNNGGKITACCNKGEVSGTYSVGGIAGTNYTNGTITVCDNIGEVSGKESVGGIAGTNYETITACCNKGIISETDIGKAGGIVGGNYGKITACYNTENVSGYKHIGGITGYNDETITACYNTGNVSKSSIGNSSGGIAGYNYYGKITACYWSVPEESSITSGIGADYGTGTTTKVDESWADALSGMNEALSEAESEYSYEENDNQTTKETMPLIIVKSSN